jgi:hypothetical protein
VDKAIAIFESLDSLKATELREWQELPAHERLRTVSELTVATCRMKDPSFEVQKMEKTLVQIQRRKNDLHNSKA